MKSKSSYKKCNCCGAHCIHIDVEDEPCYGDVTRDSSIVNEEIHTCEGHTVMRYYREPGSFYEGTRFCDHCEKDTKHICRDSTHERDSSDDYQKCLECGWYMTGYSGEYNPPIGDD